tara:strand:- start:350 stop:589 length:240 start_codon:yes stop_codon:yes gene_type:complete
MNERIKELAAQVGFGEKWFEEHSTGCSLPKPLMLKEYTELIIQECIEQVYPEQFKNIGVDPTNLADAVSRIKEHFGIEE